jgi:CubicO group peptidase (beta-lactamase class C family)
MYATGGWAATAAAGGALNNLGDSYHQAMQERILTPIGMDRSTFDLQHVLADGDYAQPHGWDLYGQTRQLPVLLDGRFGTLASGPAGGLWSNARDMSRYVETQLSGGVAPNGRRVVSTANLERTRTPAVVMPSVPTRTSAQNEGSQAYGLGWELGAYKGQPLVSHGGATWGFASQVAFMPQAGLGIIILTNGGSGAFSFGTAVEYRLFEILFNQPEEVGPAEVENRQKQLGAFAALRTQTGPIDPIAVAPYQGRFTNPTLGDVLLSLRGGSFVFQTGAVRSELRAQQDGSGQIVSYFFADPPLSEFPMSLTFQAAPDGRPRVTLKTIGEPVEDPEPSPEGEHTATAIPTNSYIFTPVAPTGG